MTTEILGIITGAIVTIGVAVNQIKKQRQKTSDKRFSDSNNEIWVALDSIRCYLEYEMSIEGKETRTFTFQPYFDFPKILMSNKSNLNQKLYFEISEFFKLFNHKTELKLVNLIKKYHQKNLFPNEKSKIETQANKKRLELLNEINNFMNTVRLKLE